MHIGVTRRFRRFYTKKALCNKAVREVRGGGLGRGKTREYREAADQRPVAAKSRLRHIPYAKCRRRVT